MVVDGDVLLVEVDCFELDLIEFGEVVALFEDELVVDWEDSDVEEGVGRFVASK